jgi:hypothetical protein
MYLELRLATIARPLLFSVTLTGPVVRIRFLFVVGIFHLKKLLDFCSCCFGERFLVPHLSGCPEKKPDRLRPCRTAEIERCGKAAPYGILLTTHEDSGISKSDREDTDRFSRQGNHRTP